MSGNCPSYIFSDAPVIQFVSGTAVVYGPVSNPLTNGATASGDATVTFGTDGTYEGHTLLWFGQNINNKGQAYFGENINLSVSGIDGTVGSLNITATFGVTDSPSGHVAGWDHVNIICS